MKQRQKKNLKNISRSHKIDIKKMISHKITPYYVTKK